MNQNFAVGADQKGITHAVEVQRVNTVGNGFQTQITTHYSKVLTGLLHGINNGNHQLASCQINIGFSQCRNVAALRTFIPRPYAWVVAVRHLAVWPYSKTAIRTAEVNAHKAGSEGFLVEHIAHVRCVGIKRNRLREVFNEQGPPVQPGLNVACSGATHFLQVVLQIGANRIALQVIVVQGKECEGCNHDQRSGQQNFMAEAQIVIHGV